MSDKEYWELEEFEDSVDKGIIALYETDPYKRANKGWFYYTSPAEIKAMRSFGLYFPPKDRLTLGDEVYDTGSTRGCVTSVMAEGTDEDGTITGYLGHTFYRRVSNRLLGNLMPPSSPGWLYEVYRYMPLSSEGFICLKSHAWLNKDGRVIALKYRKPSNLINHVDFIEQSEKAALLLAAASGYWDDRRHMWNVQATEGEARVTLGVYEDQIKSLFYSRKAPVTDKGRKRPILHWVSAHRRRMKEGIDVDIERFLRGTNEFEMRGTLFKITRPLKGN